MNKKITQLKEEIEKIKNDKALSKTAKHFHYVSLDNELDKLLKETLSTVSVKSIEINFEVYNVNI